jgi:hypothetical protein
LRRAELCKALLRLVVGRFGRRDRGLGLPAPGIFPGLQGVKILGGGRRRHGRLGDQQRGVVYLGLLLLAQGDRRRRGFFNIALGLRYPGRGRDSRRSILGSQAVQLLGRLTGVFAGL